VVFDQAVVAQMPFSLLEALLTDTSERIRFFFSVSLTLVKLTTQ